MPLQYDMHSAPDYAHVHVAGTVGVNEYLDCMSACIAEKAFVPALPVLFEVGDTTHLDIGDIADEEIDQMAALIHAARGGADYRVAVAGGPPDVRTFFVLAQALANEQPECLTFGDVPEALDWLCPRSKVANPKDKKVNVLSAAGS